MRTTDRLPRNGIHPRCLFLLVLGVLPFFGSATPQDKAPRDRQEYELIQKAFAKETPPQEKLKYLDEWKQKYPETAFEVDRLRIYVASYQQTNQGNKAVQAAKELLTKVPSDFSALYTVASQTPFLENSSEGDWAEGERAAQVLLNGGIEKQFEASNPPSSISESQWNSAKNQTIGTVHQTLGWIAMKRGDHVTAEEEFVKSLEANPNSGQVSYWLGQELLAQAKADKSELALFSFARAASYDGPGSLPPHGRQQLREYLLKVYTKYAGTDEGLDKLMALAATSPLPPPGLRITPKVSQDFVAEPAAANEEGWREVARWNGNGLKNTQDFKVSRNSWRIVWKAAEGGTGVFQISIFSADGKLAGMAANQTTGGEDTSYHRGAGSYYLQINSVQMEWLVIVQEQTQ